MRAFSRWAILFALTMLAWAPCACSRRQAATAQTPAGTSPPSGVASPQAQPSQQEPRSPGGASSDAAGSQQAAEARPAVTAAGETPGPSGVPPAASPAQDTPEDADAEIRPSREILLRRQNNPAAEAPGPAPTPLELEQQALLALPSSSVLPEDFRIGELADLLQSDSLVRGTTSLARSFLEALVRGEVDSALIEPGRREELARSLAYYLSAGDRPNAYRVGGVQLDAAEPDRAWLNVRLFGSLGRTEGELYLQRSSQRWYVLDLQAQLADLRQPYARAEERYYPSIYAWGLE